MMGIYPSKKRYGIIIIITVIHKNVHAGQLSADTES